MTTIEEKIQQKLLDLSFQLGQHDYATSIHDYSDSYHEKEEVKFAATILLDLIDEKNFPTYIINNEASLKQYALGYLNNLEDINDLLEDINKGSVGRISIKLNEKQQKMIRKMAVDNFAN